MPPPCERSSAITTALMNATVNSPPCSTVLLPLLILTLLHKILLNFQHILINKNIEKHFGTSASNMWKKMFLTPLPHPDNFQVFSLCSEREVQVQPSPCSPNSSQRLGVKYIIINLKQIAKISLINK